MSARVRFFLIHFHFAQDRHIWPCSELGESWDPECAAVTWMVTAFNQRKRKTA